MITNLTIRNYTLIDSLEIDFQRGFSVITGETGAGKSIILGALGLLLGNRADSKSVAPGKKKCVIEAHFNITDCGLTPFFDTNGIEYDETDCILRRELTESGKSRAFINDTPVSLAILKSLGENLVDIHSQHQNLLLLDADFQLQVTDIMAKNQDILAAYHKAFAEYTEALEQLSEMKRSLEASREKEDYIRFVFNELTEAAIHDAKEQENLEIMAESMEHVEEIKITLFSVDTCFNGENGGILQSVKHVCASLENIQRVFPAVTDIAERTDSTLIELKDIAAEAQSLLDTVDFDPGEQQRTLERLDLLNTLERKHHCADLTQLIELRESLEKQIDLFDNSDDAINEQQRRVEERRTEAEEIARKLSERRKEAAALIDAEMQRRLVALGMPKVRFVTEISRIPQLMRNGTDKVTFLFSANSSMPVQPVAHVASGGEVARVMLSLKSLISNAVSLPTIIFDEVDTGVSGKIAEAMARIMHEMGCQGRQVLSITHLPQIAAMGATHYYVRKTEDAEGTHTNMTCLTNDERIEVIAQMLSGSDVSEAAREQARQLLSRNA